jgi:hypothetical protein
MCVSLKHGLVIVSDYSKQQLILYSLADGSLVRTIGGEGRGKGHFLFTAGGLCVSPDGDSVLVAEDVNDRVQQVLLTEQSSFVRFVGEEVLNSPQYVDCNYDFIAVSAPICCCISVLSWEGDLIFQFGSCGGGPTKLRYPRGLRLLKGRKPAVVVADRMNHRVCVFKLFGELLAEVRSSKHGSDTPCDVQQTENGDFVVANFGGHNLVKLSRDGMKIGTYSEQGGDRSTPIALAALTDGGMVVREKDKRFQVFHDCTFRVNWIAVCTWVY